MDSMYKLTKQIDALTFNSRAVLNALVRSCIAAGSSNGYTVKRFGLSLTLDRTDIYRLYDFYQSWANGTCGYAPYTSDPDEFSSILLICDSKWKGDGRPVTKAVVTHSKILYLVTGNKDNTSDDYWTGLVRDSASPKLVTNSAPIPLNLRTPLYDADLSTKSFSQYETYLFPSGYNKIGITGMPGDGEDHVGGGRSWLWDIDETLEVTAPRIMLGYHSNPSRRLDNFLGHKYGMSFGRESYPLGERSVTLGGFNDIAYGADSAIIGGYHNLALGPQSAILSGYINTTAGQNSVSFGMRVDSIAPNSMAGNMDTVAGDFAYDFTIEEPESGVTVVDCEAIEDRVAGKCVVTEGSTGVLEGEGRNTVRISYASLVSEGFWDINIERGDTVIVYAQTRKEGTRTYKATDTKGYAFKPLTFKVTGISRSNGDYLVQLDGNIPRGETFESMWVNGGKISRYEVNVREMAYNGSLGPTVTKRPGHSSNALNYHTFTSGVNQTVVGQMNAGNRDAKFIVGIGSSYVGNKAFRRNGLVVAQGYSYLQTADRAAMIGMSDYGNKMYRDYDALYAMDGAWLRHSHTGEFSGYVVANDTRTKISLESRDGTHENNLTFVRSGSSYLSSRFDVTTRLESMAGTMVITAGSYVGARHTYEALLEQGPLRVGEGNGIAIYSENGMELRNTNEERMMSFHNSGYISSTFKGLFLNGQTWGALTATDKARSFWVYHDMHNRYSDAFMQNGHAVDYPNVIARSGFFYGQNDWKPGHTPSSGRINLPSKVRGGWESNQGRGLHIINSAVSYINQSGDRGYDVSCLVLPGQVRSDDIANPPHPKFINSFIYGTGNNGVMPKETYVAEELAYLSDVEHSRPVSYISYIQYDSVRKTFSRTLANSSADNIDYRPPTFDAGTFYEADIFAGTSTGMCGYFGNINGSRFAIQPASGSHTPGILASDDSPNRISLKRYGSTVSAGIIVDMPGTPDKFSEVLVVSYRDPCAELGITGSLVLNGAGLGGVSVSCTISRVIGETFTIGGTDYDSAYMYDFLIKSPDPNAVAGTKVPITLVGTI